jgi:beta-glucanase (GH16 family)
MILPSDACRTHWLATALSRALSLIGCAAASAACNTLPPESVGDAWSGPQGSWVEVFRDDFDGPTNGAPDPAIWNVERRERGQNQELDFNTTERTNSHLDGQGHLVIVALEERYEVAPGRLSTQPYTSARLNTRGRVEMRHGRIEARIRLPAGRGLWPAFWLLGSNVEEVGWPESGEIDILELAGSRPHVVSGSLHGPGYAGAAALSRDVALDSAIFADDFHVFALEWTTDGIRWLLDGDVYHQRTKAGMEALGLRWVFDGDFYIIVNLAVGGSFDGPPDESTQFPSRLSVDYISVSRLE